MIPSIRLTSASSSNEECSLLALPKEQFQSICSCVTSFIVPANENNVAKPRIRNFALLTMGMTLTQVASRPKHFHLVCFVKPCPKGQGFPIFLELQFLFVFKNLKNSFLKPR